jgi:hypothetical protein
MGLAAISYRGLVSACVPYAETVKAAFDVYRQGLLTAIGWHAAPGLETERYQWAQVGVCIRLPSAALAGLGTVTRPRKARRKSPAAG